MGPRKLEERESWAEFWLRISRVHFRHRRAPHTRDARSRRRWKQKRRKRSVSGEC